MFIEKVKKTIYRNNLINKKNKMKQQINEIRRMQQLSGIVKESQLNEMNGDFRVNEDTWNKWLSMSDELDYDALPNI